MLKWIIIFSSAIICLLFGTGVMLTGIINKDSMTVSVGTKIIAPAYLTLCITGTLFITIKNNSQQGE